MIKEKIYKCNYCNKLLNFSTEEYKKNLRKPMPFFCESCKKWFGWEEGKEQEALDFLKQVLNMELYTKEELCKPCDATGNLKRFENDFELCPLCEGFGVTGNAKEKEEEKEAVLNGRKDQKKKGISIDNKAIKEMKRLKAKGVSIKENKIIYNVPQVVKDKKNKEFLKKKAARILAKKSKKKKK